MVDVYWKSDKKASHIESPSALAEFARAPKQPSCVELPHPGQKRLKLARRSTLKDLCPEDKGKVKQLIQDLAKVGSDKERLEALQAEERKRFRELLAAELLSSQQQLQTLLRSSEVLPPQGQDIVSTSGGHLEVGVACTQSSASSDVTHFGQGSVDARCQEAEIDPCELGSIVQDLPNQVQPALSGVLASAQGDSRAVTGDPGVLISSTCVGSTNGVQRLPFGTFRPQSKTQRPLIETQRPLIETQRPLVATHLISETPGQLTSETQRPLSEVQRLSFATQKRTLSETQRPLDETQRPPVDAPMLPDHTLRQLSYFQNSTAHWLRRRFNRRPSKADEPMGTSQVTSCSVYKSPPTCLPVGSPLGEEIVNMEAPQRSYDGCAGSTVCDVVWTTLPPATPVSWDNGGTQNSGNVVEQLSLPAHYTWASPPKTRPPSMIQPPSKAQAFLKVLPSESLPQPQSETGHLSPNTNPLPKTHSLPAVQLPPKNELPPQQSQPQLGSMVTRNTRSLSSHEVGKVTSSIESSCLVAQGLPTARDMREISTQTASTESTGTQTHTPPSLPVSPSVLSRDAEMQTASEPPSHNVTREGEEEGGKGDNPDTLGPCLMDGCSNTTYYDGPFCTTPDCGNVHMGSCPAAKPGVGSGSRPGDRVLADFGFYPISGSRLCSEARPGDVPHFDCHRESLMASTLLNDQELAPLLATPIGGRYNNPASTSGLEWQSGSSERYVDGILDQSLELKPPSNSAAQNHGKVRPLSPKLATSMIWAELERPCDSFSKPCLKKQSSEENSRYPRNRTTEAVENDILKDLFFV
ncbi:hypothetical protein EMCRGX_G029882 [Ephydatia muelleri]